MKLHLANSLVIMTCVLALVCGEGQADGPGTSGWSALEDDQGTAACRHRYRDRETGERVHAARCSGHHLGGGHARDANGDGAWDLGATHRTESRLARGIYR